MNIAKLVEHVTQASQEEDAPQAFKDIVVEHAARSPVELLTAVVRWAADLADADISALPDDCWRAVYRCSEAVAAYRFHALDQTAAQVLARRDPPPAPTPADPTQATGAAADATTATTSA